MRKLLIAVLLSLVPSIAMATVWQSPSCSQTDVQNTINAGTTVTGDTVQVLGPCTLQFSSFVTVPSSKGIYVQGVSNPIISSTSEGFILNAGSSTTRIGGFTCNRASNIPTDFNGHCLQINTGTATFRIDHWTFCAGGGSCNIQGIFVSVNGNGPGLFDHNLYQSNGSAMMQINGAGNFNPAGWMDDITPGGPNMLFLEDNTFINTGCLSNCSSGSAGPFQSYNGARIVFRHNTVQEAGLDFHGSAGGGQECSTTAAWPDNGTGAACVGFVGVRWYEVYQNNWNIVPGGGQFSFSDMRAGTGVFWGNTVTGGTATGFRYVRFYEENTLAWPQAWQVGSGICPTCTVGSVTSPHDTCGGGTLNTAPAYAWGNDAQFNLQVNTSTTADPNAVLIGRDIFFSTTQPASMHWKEKSTDTCATTYNYVPFTYPHPLISPTPAVSLSRSSIAFGNQNVNTSSANVNTVVTNTGNGNLTVSSVAITGADLTQYSINTNTCTVTILPGGTCSFNTVFSPTSTGLKNAFSTVTSNAPTNPNNVTLSGTGTNPITVTITVQPSPLAFGNQIVGQVSTPVAVTVTSTGTGNEVLGTPFANFTAGGVNPVPADFALAGSGGSPCSNALSLAPGINCTFTATITATQAALETATLNVNGTVSATIQASGTGIQASPVPAPAPQIFSTLFGIGTIDLVVGNCPKTCKIHLVCTNCTTSYTGTIQ